MGKQLEKLWYLELTRVCGSVSGEDLCEHHSLWNVLGGLYVGLLLNNSAEEAHPVCDLYQTLCGLQTLTCFSI